MNERKRKRALFEQTIFGVAFADLQGRFIEVNPAYCRITGYTERELLATDVTSITHPADQAENQSLVQRAVAGEIPGFVIEKRYVRKDGSDVWVRIAVSLIRDTAGRAIGLLALTFDLTDRKEMEQELRRRKDELTNFFEYASVGLHWVGPDGIIKWANAAELAMLGYSKEVYEGHHIAEFHADQEVIADILARLGRGDILTEYEARLRRKDGAIRHALIDSCVLWEDGRFVHTQCFTRDITEQKLADEVMRRRTAQFETLLNEAPLGVYLVDADFRIRQVNPTALPIFGDIPDLIGRDFRDVIHILWPAAWRIARAFAFFS